MKSIKLKSPKLIGPAKNPPEPVPSDRIYLARNKTPRKPQELIRLPINIAQQVGSPATTGTTSRIAPRPVVYPVYGQPRVPAGVTRHRNSSWLPPNTGPRTCTKGCSRSRVRPGKVYFSEILPVGEHVVHVRRERPRCCVHTHIHTRVKNRGSWVLI